MASASMEYVCLLQDVCDTVLATASGVPERDLIERYGIHAVHDARRTGMLARNGNTVLLPTAAAWDRIDHSAAAEVQRIRDLVAQHLQGLRVGERVAADSVAAATGCTDAQAALAMFALRALGNPVSCPAGHKSGRWSGTISPWRPPGTWDQLEARARHGEQSFEKLLLEPTLGFTGAHPSAICLDTVTLEKVTAMGAVLDAPRFRGATFRECHLAGSQMPQAQFQAAKLEAVTLAGAYLLFANFVGAELLEVDLSGSDLRGVRFEGATLNSVAIQGANIQGASFSDFDQIDRDTLLSAYWEKILVSGEVIERALLAKPDLTLEPCGNGWLVGFRGARLGVSDRLATAELAAVRARAMQTIHALDVLSVVQGLEMGAPHTQSTLDAWLGDRGMPTRRLKEAELARVGAVARRIDALEGAKEDTTEERDRLLEYLRTRLMANAPLDQSDIVKKLVGRVTMAIKREVTELGSISPELGWHLEAALTVAENLRYDPRLAM